MDKGFWFFALGMGIFLLGGAAGLMQAEQNLQPQP